MAAEKTATVTFRIAPVVKTALRAASAREHRSLANMPEVMIRDSCRHNGVEVAAQWKNGFLVLPVDPRR